MLFTMQPCKSLGSCDSAKPLQEVNTPYNAQCSLPTQAPITMDFTTLSAGMTMSVNQHACTYMYSYWPHRNTYTMWVM